MMYTRNGDAALAFTHLHVVANISAKKAVAYNVQVVLARLEKKLATTTFLSLRLQQEDYLSKAFACQARRNRRCSCDQ